MDIKSIVDNQREYFCQGETFDISFRRSALEKLENAILKYESRLYASLKADLDKSQSEAYMCEIGLTLSELRFIKKRFAKWAKTRRVPTPIAQFAGKSFNVWEPYGVALIMSPWNYPMLLTLEPLVGAIAAGNCAVLKPSAYSPATSEVICELISETFDKKYITVIEGGRNENTELLNQKFDYIFFTGSVNVGKTVMAKAAENLTPVTLELGGKSPCIVDKTADLKIAARRIVFGKIVNCGQTCVAPDYVLAEKSVKDELIGYMKEEITKMLGENPLLCKTYGKIISQKHFDRIVNLIDSEKVVFGGEWDEEKLKISPTIMDDVTENDKIMQEEIFGPVLPVISVENTAEAFDFVYKRPSPLALYLFTSDKATEKVFTTRLKYGGGCINDTLIHLATSKMAFGGVGNSGMGSYHGRKSFETFSHSKGIIKKYTFIDLSMRYQPYNEKNDKLIRKFLK